MLPFGGAQWHRARGTRASLSGFVNCAPSSPRLSVLLPCFSAFTGGTMASRKLSIEKRHHSCPLSEKEQAQAPQSPWSQQESNTSNKEAGSSKRQRKITLKAPQSYKISASTRRCGLSPLDPFSPAHLSPSVVDTEPCCSSPIPPLESMFDNLILGEEEDESMCPYECGPFNLDEPLQFLFDESDSDFPCVLCSSQLTMTPSGTCTRRCGPLEAPALCAC